MTKNQKILLGLAIAVGLYLFMKKSTKKISEREKVDLFEKALSNYVGGAAPHPELLKRLEETRNQANKKIKELGLQGEFEAYRNNKPKRDPNAPLPQ